MALRTLVEAINDALRCEMAADDRVILLGEDIGREGGVFQRPSCVPSSCQWSSTLSPTEGSPAGSRSHRILCCFGYFMVSHQYCWIPGRTEEATGIRL